MRFTSRKAAADTAAVFNADLRSTALNIARSRRYPTLIGNLFRGPAAAIRCTTITAGGPGDVVDWPVRDQ